MSDTIKGIKFNENYVGFSPKTNLQYFGTSSTGGGAVAASQEAVGLQYNVTSDGRLRLYDPSSGKWYKQEKVEMPDYTKLVPDFRGYGFFPYFKSNMLYFKLHVPNTMYGYKYYGYPNDITKDSDGYAAFPSYYDVSINYNNTSGGSNICGLNSTRKSFNLTASECGDILILIINNKSTNTITRIPMLMTGEYNIPITNVNLPVSLLVGGSSLSSSEYIAYTGSIYKYLSPNGIITFDAVASAVNTYNVCNMLNSKYVVES